MFTVGDIGYLDEDGYLFLCDRKADTIISGGVNIYPAEVEATLLQHPAVGDAAVIGVPNDEWGEEVRAVVELRDARRPSRPNSKPNSSSSVDPASPGSNAPGRSTSSTPSSAIPTASSARVPSGPVTGPRVCAESDRRDDPLSPDSDRLANAGGDPASTRS